MDHSGPVKELFAHRPKVNKPSEPSQRAKSKVWCLVYWIEDKQVSIENLTSVGENARREGDVSHIRFKDGKKYPGKILRINENKQLLREEQDRVPCSIADDVQATSEGVSSSSSKRVRKKSSKMTDFIATREEEAVQPKPAKAGKGKSTLAAKTKSKEDKLKATLDKAKVQEALCKEMLASKPTKPEILAGRDSDSDDVIMDDLESEPETTSMTTIADLEGQVSALRHKVDKLQKKLRDKDLEIEHLKAQGKPTSHPFSVAITPKKIKLMEEVTALLQSSEQSSQLTRVDSAGPQQSRIDIHVRPSSRARPLPPPSSRASPPPPPSSRASPLPPPSSRASPLPPQLSPFSAAQKASVTAADNSLTPLYPGGVPLLSEQEKRLAFSKGTNKETLLFTLLVAVFGEGPLAKGKACGLRQAHNSQDSTMPLDAGKLNEIKESVLRRFKTSSGQPCFSSKEFNEKINQKCSTVRRALKKQQAKQ